MQTLGDTRNHVYRVQRMAKSRGLDLAAAQNAGNITQADFAAMVTTCRGCGDPGGCDRLQALAREVGFCPNTDVFARLAAG